MTRTLTPIAMAAALSACATAPVPKPQALPIAPALISFDGHVAGQATDYVFVLVPDSTRPCRGLRCAAVSRSG